MTTPFLARLAASFLLAAALLLPAGTARAQSCSFSASDVVLGPVDVLGNAPTAAAGNIAISCSAFLGIISSIEMRIHLGDGSGGQGGGLRRMTGPASAQLSYQLYQDAARSVVFGGSYGAHGGQPLYLSGGSVLTLLTGSGMNVPIYARVPGGQNGARPGNYSSAFLRDPLDVRVEYTTCNLLGLICTARTATFGFNLRAQVQPDCRVEADDLDFGAHGLLNQPVDASSQIRVSCTSGSSYSVGLGYGLHGNGPGDRQMRDLAGNRIGYQLFRDNARTQPWGLATDGLAMVAAGSGSSQPVSVHGRVPAQPTPPPGAYADTVTVTVTY